MLEAHRDFFKFFEAEIDKVQVFYMSQLKYYSKLLQNAQLKFYTKFSDEWRQRSASERAKDINAIANSSKHITRDLALLKSYVEVNRTAARKILKKHDKLTGVATKDKVLEKVAKERTFFLAEELRHLTQTAQAFQSEVSKFIVRHAI